MNPFWIINGGKNKLNLFLESFSFETPKHYGWFHLTYFLVFILISIFLIYLFKKPTIKQIKIIFLVLYIPLFFIELLKQINATGPNFDTYKDKPWALPFVLCSMPLYVIPLYLLIPSKHKIVSNALLSYLSIINLWSGLFVMLYPGDVFTTSVFTSNHTMIYHGILFIIGVWSAIRQIVKYNWKTFVGGFIIFIIIFIFIIMGNEIIYQLNIHNKTTYRPNLFNISHRFLSPMIAEIPLLNKLPYWIPTLIYPFFTIIASSILYTIFWGFSIAFFKIENKVLNKINVVQKNKIAQ